MICHFQNGTVLYYIYKNIFDNPGKCVRSIVLYLLVYVPFVFAVHTWRGNLFNINEKIVHEANLCAL